MKRSDKEQIVQLYEEWIKRSKLTKSQILSRVQTSGCDITRFQFDGRLVRLERTTDIEPKLALAIVGAFTDRLTDSERCTAEEAIKFAMLSRFPAERFQELRKFFPADEFNEAIRLLIPDFGDNNREEKAEVESSAKHEPHKIDAVVLPGKTYNRLIGRPAELKRVLDILRELDRKPIIAIIGLGGIGKTALAREVAERSVQEKLFDYIVWTSAQIERFVGEGVIRTEVSDYDFDQFLSDIGRQCNRLDIAKMPSEQKIEAINYLLGNNHVLIVIDNLETIAEQDKFVDNAFQLLGQSKLLITSRHHVKHERAFTIDLDGLSEKAGITFLREESQERGIDDLTQTTEDNLIRIHQATGGAPLALKLVAGQLSGLSLETVLYDLEKAKFEGRDYLFYRFIFKRSWDLLNFNAKKLLISMSVFAPSIGGVETAIQEVAALDRDDFTFAIEQLIIMSLVDPLGNLIQRRYAIHQLTHYFILSDIIKKWG